MILHNNSRIHNLLKHTWNILQDGPYIRPKTILSKFKRAEITQRMFSNYYEMKWDFNNRRVCGKFTNRWNLNNTFLKTNGTKEKSQSKLESNLR